jgi:hypothetical protein
MVSGRKRGKAVWLTTPQAWHTSSAAGPSPIPSAPARRALSPSSNCESNCESVLGEYPGPASAKTADLVRPRLWQWRTPSSADHSIEPKRLHTDNAFTCIHNRSLRELLAKRGIQHRRIPPRTPKRAPARSSATNKPSPANGPTGD